MQKTNSLLVSIISFLLLTSVIIPLDNSAQNPTFRAQNITAVGSEVNFVNDTFTEASDIDLASHTPELGSTWVNHPDSAYLDVINILGATDRIALVASAGGGAYYNDVTPPSADYCSEGVIKVVSIISANTAITTRMNTSANTMYIFQLNNGTGWRVRKILAGVQTTIGTEDTTTNIPSVGDVRTMKLCSIGTAITAYINGVLLTNPGGTDSSISAVGKAGVRFTNGTTTTGYHFESFRAFTP